MNFLAHIYLSGNNDLVTIGNFIADGIRGKKYLEFPIDIQTGILLHRQIDTFTDAHKTVRESTKRLHKNYSHYSGVIVDILYDHFLAKNWASYSDGTGVLIVSDMKNTGLALGFTTGYKWVARNGLVFESFFGLGRYLVNNYSYDPDIPDNNINNFLFEELPAFDLRFGLGVGYRFGG